MTELVTMFPTIETYGIKTYRIFVYFSRCHDMPIIDFHISNIINFIMQMEFTLIVVLNSLFSSIRSTKIINNIYCHVTVIELN